MGKIVGNFTRVGVVCCFLVTALLAVTPFTALAGDTIKIGHLDPHSGFMKIVGDQAKEMWSILLEEVNAKGGVLGKKVEVIFEDNEYRPEVAVRKAKKLILQDKVDFIASGVGSHIAIALNRVATANKKIYFNFGGITDAIQGKFFTRYAFRMCHNVHQVAAIHVWHMAQKPYRKFYIICPDYVFGHDYARAIKEMVKKVMPDAKIVGEDYHPIGTKDFAPYVTKIIASGADAIVSGNFYTDSLLFIKTVREMGLKAPFPIFAFEAVNGNVSQALGDQVVGISESGPYLFELDTPRNNAYVKKWHEKNKHKAWQWWWTPRGNASWEYMGWQMIFAAIEKAGSTDPEKFIPVFEGFRYKTILDWWEMRACDHQILLPEYAYEFAVGKNKWYDFNWIGEKTIVRIPAEKLALPATPDYNPRCK